jgi:hypothetical protein
MVYQITAPEYEEDLILCIGIEALKIVPLKLPANLPAKRKTGVVYRKNNC